jgi:hypothetical protein
MVLSGNGRNGSRQGKQTQRSSVIVKRDFHSSAAGKMI